MAEYIDGQRKENYQTPIVANYKEYIDKQALLDEFEKFGFGKHGQLEKCFAERAFAIIGKVPTADVVHRSEVNDLEYTLMGVMHSVDKWLEGDELEQDEVNRAATMREKLLQIIEQLETERDRYKRHYFQHNYDECRAEGIKEFAERLRSHYPHTASILKRIDCIEKEMTEG